MSAMEFRRELEKLINRESMENGSNTPDFILATYLKRCLDTFDFAVNAREHWFGRLPEVKATPLETSAARSPLLGYHYSDPVSSSMCCEGQGRMTGADVPPDRCEHGNPIHWHT